VHSSDGRAGIDAALVRRLIAAQFPQWQHLPIRPVELDGWDNRTYRLGDELTVRLPTDAAYVPAVAKEDRWLPVLAPQLPVPIPVPVAVGQPAAGYPFPWSIRRWLDGEPATSAEIADLAGFAVEVAEFLLALQRIDPTGGPAAGAHSFHRGGSLRHYHQETHEALTALAARPDAGGVDIAGAQAVWQAALAAPWDGLLRWFHGDVAAGNLLVRQGKLTAVIDFGTSGVGDPTCDLVIAWTLFTGASREAFRIRVDQDPDSWARARGWALWKALISLVMDLDVHRPDIEGDSERASHERQRAGAERARSRASGIANNRRIVADVIAEHAAC
jgi:aminoglycoside phosphotransferase (APT) family kinase protein